MSYPIQNAESMRIVVIGAGAAGMVAAAEAAERGAQVILLEKNGKTGAKILMSGGTRCNVTQDTDARGIAEVFGKAGRFLQRSVGAFPPESVVQMFAKLGVATKRESTGKIFPVSDRALDVRDALQRRVEHSGCQLRLRSPVHGIRREGARWHVDIDGESIPTDRVIVTAGGMSWPGCGTTGDGYGWLGKLGHTIVPTRPALVPLVGGYDWTCALSGLTVEDCVVSVYATDKSKAKKGPLASRRSSLLFTHFGLSGPAAMDVSGTMTKADHWNDVRMSVDLIPDVDRCALEQILRDRNNDGGRRRVAGVLSRWLPKRLADAMVIHTTGVDEADVSVAELAKTKRVRLVENVKALTIPVHDTKGFAKAEVTAGGVALPQVDPRTMASRVAEDLYIAGEVLDVDGFIGGYNFQAAFSTGRAAGVAAASTK